ncbi:hypothetical protein [Kribbella sp. NPDC000426]|uniref:hypothetical protein n=1 Tax=Kribbella sp. NPDC000426 TaxID=3154255 RepID=UPI00332A1955
MEPLNLMVSLSHFANDNRDNKHGLSQPAGRRKPVEKPPLPSRRRAWWAIRARAAS